MKDTVINDEDVKWEMHWDQNKHPNQPEIEIMFEPAQALARLLAEQVIFLNDHWWCDDWPADAKKMTSLNVNCNDVFAWACAEGEEMLYSELRDLYDHWEKDPSWGPAVWCCKKRNEMPQKPVYDMIQAAGIWDLESMHLKPNRYGEFLRERAAQNKASATREAAG